jgi:hypothetical protein
MTGTFLSNCKKDEGGCNPCIYYFPGYYLYKLLQAGVFQSDDFLFDFFNNLRIFNYLFISCPD